MSNLSASVDKPICVPSEIPPDWAWQELVKCCRPRQWPTISKEQLLNEGFPVYGANGLIGYYSEYNHEESTIAVTCRGATCGTLNYVPARSYITGNAMCLDDLDQHKISDKYLYYALLHRGLSDVITGSAQPQITGQSLKKVKFPCPKLPEQEKIAEILESMDDAIAKTERVIAQTQRVKKCLLQQLLTRGIGHTKFKQTELGEIPESWAIVSMSEFCSKVSDGTHDTPKRQETGVPLLTSKNLKSYGLDFSDYYCVSERDAREINKRSRVDKFDILYGMIGTIGNPVIVRDLETEFVIKNVALFKFDGDLLKASWAHMFLESALMEGVISSKQAGNAQKFLSLKLLRSILIPVPSKREMGKIIIIKDSISCMLDENFKKLSKLRLLKSGLMSDLLTGRVRVKVDAKSSGKVGEAA